MMRRPVVALLCLAVVASASRLLAYRYRATVENFATADARQVDTLHFTATVQCHYLSEAEAEGAVTHIASLSAVSCESDARRPRHLPLPAAELQAMRLPFGLQINELGTVQG